MPDAAAIPAAMNERSELQRGIDAATGALIDRQRADGHFLFELEADATIPAEYVLLRHYLAEPVDAPLESKIAAYLRRVQGAHGGWPLFQDGDFDMSASVKAYFALKMIGDPIDAPHMRRAREAILARGGAGRANVFTRIMLALFGFIAWRAVPVMPVEIMLLPRWFPFHVDKISYWSRTVIVPLLVLMALKPQARNRKRVRIDELFLGAARAARARSEGAAAEVDLVRVLSRRRRPAARLRAVFSKEDASAGHRARRRIRDRATQRRERPRRHFSGDGQQRHDVRRAGTDSLRSAAGGGAQVGREASGRPHPRSVLPALRLTRLGYRTGLSRLARGGRRDRGRARAQRPRLAASRAGARHRRRLVRRATAAAAGRVGLQYANPHYPDVDDTAVVVMAMDREQRLAGHDAFAGSIARAREWIIGMQSQNGGWGAFDADNEYYYLNHIPFADHGALLDPPTEDVTARCLSMLVQLGESRTHPAVQAAIDYLRRTQLGDGSWYGRWGMNYIYGTWSVLCALNATGVEHGSAEMRRAVEWLIAIQNPDGGWGEDGTSYRLDYQSYQGAPSTASQTAWALLGLMAAGEVGRPAVKSGIDYLLRGQGKDGFWQEPRYTATGFPRVFYLRYHGYSKYFPLWALARYRNLKTAGSTSVAFGM